MRALLDLMQGYVAGVSKDRPSTLQLIVLRVIFVVSMVIAGVSGGFVVAFFVYLISSEGNGWPAVSAFFVTVALCSGFGLYTAIFKMRPATKDA